MVLILRRLANVLGTLSISNQYLLRSRRGQAEEWEEAAANENEKQTPGVNKACRPSVVSSLRGQEWSDWIKQKSWTWPESMMTLGFTQHPVSSTASLEVPHILRGEFGFILNCIPSHCYSASSIESGSAEPSNSPDGSQSSSSPQTHSPRPSNRSNISPQPRKGKAKEEPDIIHQLLQNPALYEPMRKPRYPIVLCHGTITTTSYALPV